MGMKIWELHGMQLGGAIRSTPDGDANVDGLVLSEKAYLLAVRDFRPHQLVELVRRHGPDGAAAALIAHYGEGQVNDPLTGRGLRSARSGGTEPMVRRSDELGDTALARER